VGAADDDEVAGVLEQRQLGVGHVHLARRDAERLRALGDGLGELHAVARLAAIEHRERPLGPGGYLDGRLDGRQWHRRPGSIGASAQRVGMAGEVAADPEGLLGTELHGQRFEALPLPVAEVRGLKLRRRHGLTLLSTRPEKAVSGGN
jgi:hypothetical protein